MSPEFQHILRALQRIEDKLDGKADQSDLDELEGRVRKNEKNITQAYAYGAGASAALSAALAWIGIKHL